jgi:aspartyl-tRNA(Asn)/glutamyl-tRNA(Gln) amidotransferase subunit C
MTELDRLLTGHATLRGLVAQTRSMNFRLALAGAIPNLLCMADFDVKYVAHLARLGLTAEEEQKFGAQLGQVLGYIEKLKAVDVSHVEPTAHAVPLVNVTRPDEVRPSISNEDALRNAPAKANGLFVVPKIVE